MAQPKAETHADHPVRQLGPAEALKRLRSIPGLVARNDEAERDLKAGKGTPASELDRPR